MELSKAAQAIAEADFILIAAGAGDQLHHLSRERLLQLNLSLQYALPSLFSHSQLGFSADSGLPVYADIAKLEKYSSRRLDYADLADTRLLVAEPEVFQEFWQSCLVRILSKVEFVQVASGC